MIGLETKFVVPAEADLVTGRREWMNAESEKEETSLWARARNVVVG